MRSSSTSFSRCSTCCRCRRSTAGGWLTGLLPGRAAWRLRQLERYGLLILIGLLFLVPLAAQSLLGFEFNPLVEVLRPPIGGCTI